MTVQINSVAIPSTMVDRGESYVFNPPRVVRQSGIGEDVTAGASSIVWRWTRMTTAEYVWWYTTLLGGAASATFPSGTTRLVNNLGTETVYTYCVVHRPVYERQTGGEYLGVTVVIDQIQ
jgi:hypothetical protein